MPETSDWITFIVILAGLSIALFGVAGAALPGTIDFGFFDQGPSGGGDVATSCDLSASVSVEGTLTDARIVEETYTQQITASSPLSYSLVSPSGSLALIGAENVKMNWRLTGAPISGSVTDTSDLGSLGFEQAKTAEFSASRLPQGSYTLTMDLVWGDGTDRLSRNVEVTC